MTIKMLIVDDEPVICRGLRETIPWETIGVEVVGDASDGVEALEQIESQPVDLVLTDIHMDGMDGLELAKELRQRYPHIRIIILSGYDYFDYARQAIRIGVEDYLLKPVDVDELMDMVRRIGGELEQEASRGREQVRDRWQNWLSRLLQNDQTLPEGSPIPGVSSSELSFGLIASQREDYALWREQSTSEERRAARRDWEERVREALAGHGQEVISAFLHPNLLIVLCVYSREPSRERLPSILTKLAGQAASGRRLHFGVSPVFHSLTEAYVHGHEAIESVQLGALQERTVSFPGEEVRSRKNRGLVTALELEKELVNFLFNGGEDELKQVWGKIMEQYRIKGCSLAEIDQAYKELKIVIQRRLRTSGIELSEELVSILEGTIDLYANNSYRAIEALIRSELMSLFSSIHSTLGGKNHWTVDRVTKYIEAHHSTDLKASEVAAWLKITPNYFSIIFNQSFGKGFAEYLNEVRIEHAKEMLSGTHDRVFEIAEKVGYNDYKYFCSIFKAHTGVTPTQYRKLADSTTA